MPDKWVLFGSTGVCGRAIISQLADKPVQLVAVSRKQRTLDNTEADEQFPANLRFAQGDAKDKHSVDSICKGATVIICAIGLPQYKAEVWAAEWPVMIENITKAAKAENALFAFLDNLYSYGPGSISMESPHIDPEIWKKSKPAVRVRVREQLKESGVRFVTVGAADFFGPSATSLSFLGDSGAGRIVADQKPMAVGSADHRHDFAYVPDIARAMGAAIDEALADSADEIVGRFWIAPHAIKGRSLRDIYRDMAEIANKPALMGKVSTIPAFAIHLLGLVVPFMGEMREMLPWWTKAYEVDDSAFCNRFRMEPTEYKLALKETVQWFADRKGEGIAK